MLQAVAEELMTVLQEFDGPFNRATEIIERIEDGAEKMQFRRGLAEIMGRTYTDLMIPVIQQYPELDPDKGQ